MLLDPESEGKIAAIIKAIASSYSIFLIGRNLGQTVIQAARNALGFTTAQPLTFLEQAYLAGKAAQTLGTDRLKRMKEEDLINWLRVNNVELNHADRAMLTQLRNETERWINGRSDAWQAKMRQEIARANQQWRTVLATTNFTDAQAISVARNKALTDLRGSLRQEATTSMPKEANRLLQSQMATFFQMGQVSGRSKDEMVYKVPRPEACDHCRRIHLDSSGQPITYKLADVMGNSNVGRPAYAWNFTVGPVHPYCYCVLYFVTDRSPETIKVPLRKSLENTCGVKDDTMLFDEQIASEPVHSDPLPEHMTAMISALRLVHPD